MALSVFDDRSHQPDDEELAGALAATFDLWNELRHAMAARFAPVSAAWGFSSKSTGWGLRLKGATRTIVYLTPRDGDFLASFALGERAVNAAHESGLSPAVLDTIDAAPRWVSTAGPDA